MEDNLEKKCIKKTSKQRKQHNILGWCSKRCFWTQSWWPANWHISISSPTGSSS